MALSLSAALEEACASGDEDGFVLTTVELDHPGFDAPVRVVRSVDGIDGDEAEMLSLPLAEGGTAVPHRPCAFSFIRPGADKDGPTDGRIRIDNVSGQLYAALKASLGYGEAITVTIRQYLVQPGNIAAVTGPDEDIAGLELQHVELTADAAEGTVAWPDGRKLNVPTGPNAFFDRDSYPALFS